MTTELAPAIPTTLEVLEDAIRERSSRESTRTTFRRGSTRSRRSAEFVDVRHERWVAEMRAVFDQYTRHEFRLRPPSTKYDFGDRFEEAQRRRREREAAEAEGSAKR